MPHRAHRHFVVLPLLLLLTVSSTVFGMFEGSQTASIDLIAGSVLPLASGGSADVSVGGTWVSDGEGGELKSGSVLVHSAAPATVHTDRLRITVMGGATFIAKDGTSVTVGALSAPALVQDGEAFLAVPAGTQWKTGKGALPTLKEGIPAWIAARKVSPLPERFLQEQQRRAREMPYGTALPQVYDGSVPVEDSAFFDAAHFPQTSVRQGEMRREKVLGILRYHIEREDMQALQQLLLQEDLSEIWESSRGHDVIAALLLTTPRSVALQQILLPVVASDPDRLLLYSLHPITSTVSWTLSAGHLGMERLAVRLFTFPFADTGTDARRALAWKRWGEDVATILLPGDGAPTAIRSVVGLLGPLAMLREQQGYPERARLLARVLLEQAERMQGDVDTQTSDILESLRRLDAVDIRTETGESNPAHAFSSAAISSSAPAAKFDQTLAERRARDLLRQGGAIISLETRVIPESATSARVENVVFGGTDRDRTLTFDLDFDRASVQRITDGAEQYPYAMPWEDFVRWVTR